MSNYQKWMLAGIILQVIGAIILSLLGNKVAPLLFVAAAICFVSLLAEIKEKK
ncbi:hypothetical protein ABID29_000336 [Streptococcus rupicaprae]|uniref:Uncharacterized protein n=1 Tax=Streptococcus rupicaprae TaxID=759619 RepID=A0ABV2FF88_9STRE